MIHILAVKMHFLRLTLMGTILCLMSWQTLSAITFISFWKQNQRHVTYCLFAHEKMRISTVSLKYHSLPILLTSEKLKTFLLIFWQLSQSLIFYIAASASSHIKHVSHCTKTWVSLVSVFWTASSLPKLNASFNETMPAYLNPKNNQTLIVYYYLHSFYYYYLIYLI